ncbi:MAG TPA: flagellar biosynthetic protein FliO [Candidatus Binatia bacterium]|nr:flagellar biosynthetic protein FliO [Candidatus Binatia bacterium]
MIADPTSDGVIAAIAAIGLLLLAALAAVRWLRGRVAGKDDGGIRLVSVRSLGGKRLLALVEVEDERFLLGMTDDRIACLGRLAPAREPAPALRSVARAEAT